MKLSTGDFVEIEVCTNPDTVNYILNGVKYNSIDRLIRVFLATQGLFTPDFDSEMSLEKLISISIYRVRLFNRLTCWFRPPYYWVNFDKSLFYALYHHLLDYPKQLEILCEYLEALLSSRTKKQTCTIYS